MVSGHRCGSLRVVIICESKRMAMNGRQNPVKARRGAVAVIRREDKLLVIRRSQSVVAPGAYCFPGGTIEAGETETVAIEREIREELGVPVRPVRCLWRSTTPWQVELAWWLAVLSPDQTLCPNPAEVDEVVWCTTAEMRRLTDLLPSNRHFLTAHERGEFHLGE